MTKTIFFILSIIFVLFNCKSQGVINDIQLRSSWLNIPPNNFSGDIVEYNIIPTLYNKKYIKELENKSFIVLNNNEYNEITGQSLKRKYAITIRAIYTNLGGKYMITKNKRNEYLVKYYVLGSENEIHKTALLLEVDKLPKNIYVFFTMAK